MRVLTYLTAVLLPLMSITAKEQPVSHRRALPPPSEIALLPENGGPEFNRLVFSNSPYLRQHARNPVDWYPWGNEAFEKAKREHKPVFLSVGYSACHWCHVMEHESFEDQQVADFLREHFVCVKVDREERPDVDAVYMQATQLFTGRGGWPNSVFLDGERVPFYAGTYWPKNDQHGRPGFMSVLTQISAAWTERPEDIAAQTEQVKTALARMEYRNSAGESDELDADLMGTVLHELEADFDSEHGGFGRNMKFPPHATLELLLHEQRHRPNAIQLGMLKTTLDQMAIGGIHDHVGGGFHRYATDRRWFLPHFEKMLYDNGQLARIYAEAYNLFQDEEYARVLRGLCDWVLRELTSDEGMFFSAYDADSEGEEGLYYIWTITELEELLGKGPSRQLAEVYGATVAGNYFEEATGHATGSNILFLKESVAGGNREALQASLLKLREFRESKRVPPGLDDKVLTSWNGLMIGGMARAGQSLNASNYVAAAERAATAVLKHQRQSDGRLFRSRREGQSALDAVLDDYVFLAAGLLDLADATGNEAWQNEARGLMNTVEMDFADGQGGYYFAQADVKDELPVRHRDPFDNATPSAVGVAAQVWERLGDAGKANNILDAFAVILERAPRSCQSLVLARQMIPSKEVETVSASYAGGVLTVTVKEGWHINGNPAAEDYLIPTKVTGDGVTVKSVKYPAAKTLSGTFEIGVELEGSGTLLVEYQPCEDDRCLAPATLAVIVD